MWTSHQTNPLYKNETLAAIYNTPMCLNPDAGMILPFESELSSDLRLEAVRKGEEIPVLITAAEERLGAVVAAMNSVYQNSKANVAFTIVTLNDTVDHLK